MASSIFDRKFVFTAIMIAVGYCAIVIVVNKLVGKEAAGVAGVALTALAAAIFKQFENLKFKSVPENEIIVEYGFNWWQVIILALLFAGMNTYLQELKDYIVPILTHAEKNDLSLLYEADTESFNGAVILHASRWTTFVECLSFFLGGIIAAQAWIRLSSGTIIISAFIGIVLDFFRETLFNFFFVHGTIANPWEELSAYRYSFLYILFAFFGVYLIHQTKKRRLSQRLTIGVPFLLAIAILATTVIIEMKAGHGLNQDFMFRGETRMEKGSQQANEHLRIALKYDSVNDSSHAYEFFLLALKEGQPRAAAFLGLNNESPLRKNNLDSALYYYRMGANEDDSWCQDLLGEFFEKGKGITQNLDSAKFWYKRGKENGSETAESNYWRLVYQPPSAEPINQPTIDSANSIDSVKP